VSKNPVLTQNKTITLKRLINPVTFKVSLTHQSINTNQTFNLGQVFSIDDGGRCNSDNTSHLTYNTYGEGTGCLEGEGAANVADVYEINNPNGETSRCAINPTELLAVFGYWLFDMTELRSAPFGIPC